MKNELFAFNGERLKKARIYRGLTVAELAEKIDCQRQTVSMYENNKIKSPENSTVIKLSQALGFPSKYFYEPCDSINIGSTYFRALLTTNKRYRNEQIQKMEFVAQIFSFLKDYVEFPSLALPCIDGSISPEDAAMSLRKEWGLGDRPIENIIFEVEQHGILVTKFNTATNDIDAFSQMIDTDNGEIYIVGYSSNKTSAARIHFDIAHELGHICLHEWSEDIEMLSKAEFKEREAEANQFASAFLLPRETFRRDVAKDPMSIKYYMQLKKKWKVSIAAMIRRAYTLDVISMEDYQYLMRVLQRRGMRKQEPLDDVIVTAQPALLRASVMMLLEEDVFTPKEFMDELSFSYNLSLYPSEVEYLLNLLPDTLRINKVIPIHNLQLKND